jgi:MerR family transcriptional regulator, light-induced transcriptional regulator
MNQGAALKTGGGSSRLGLNVGLPKALGLGMSRIATVAQHIGERVRGPDRRAVEQKETALADLAKPLQPAFEQGAHAWVQARVKALALGLIKDQGISTEAWLEQLLDGPIVPEQLGLRVLGPAANLLGQMWLEDRASFNQVGLGMWRLRHLHEDLRDRMSIDSPVLGKCGPPRSICLSGTPGERHTFGASLVAGLFESQGWFAEVMPADDGASLLSEIAARHVDVVGLTLARPELLEGLDSFIAHIRLVSANPDLVVILGGQGLASAGPADELAQKLDADLVLTDARDAVSKVTSLLPVAALATSAQ